MTSALFIFVFSKYVICYIQSLKIILNDDLFKEYTNQMIFINLEYML